MGNNSSYGPDAIEIYGIEFPLLRSVIDGLRKRKRRRIGMMSNPRPQALVTVHPHDQLIPLQLMHHSPVVTR